MNILYLIGALILLIVLGYPYVILVVANKQTGATKTVGRAISGLFVLVLVLLIVLYQTGVLQVPRIGFSTQRPTTRIMRGMSGYVVGMMTEDERAVDEFVKALKANPDLYEKVKERLK